MREQTHSFLNSISFRLAKIGVALALLLSILMNSIQVYIDYGNQTRDFERLVERISLVATPPALRAVATQDHALAYEVASGLLRYDFIYDVIIYDEQQNVLAQGRTPLNESKRDWLARLLFEAAEHHVIRLPLSGEMSQREGAIHFSVSIDQAFESFIERAKAGIVTGILRNMLFVFLLFIISYIILTKPLLKLAREITDIRPDQPNAMRLSLDDSYAQSELGKVVKSANHWLDVVELSLLKRRSVERALRNSEEHLRQILDSLPVMIGARNKDGYFLFANKSLAAALGFTSEQIRSLHARQLMRLKPSEMEKKLQQDLQVIVDDKVIDIQEEQFVTSDGRTIFLQTHMMPLWFYGEKVALAVSVDITERKTAQVKMEFMAHHDALTSLPNRIQLVERLENELRRAIRHRYFGAVLFIDLDQFKNINDSLGHPVGDKVLTVSAERLRMAVREEDFVARLSGDEFVVVLTVLDQDQAKAELYAGEVSEKIRAIVSQPILHDGMELRVTCSIGVVIYPDEKSIHSKNHVHELLRYADTAMYQGKDKGRDAIAFFNSTMAERVSKQLELEADLHRALDEHQFELFFQPKVDIYSGGIIGAEALLRWRHPTKGMISPADFIPVLETSGLIVDVGHWVIEDSCKKLSAWIQEGMWKPGMCLSVNLSPRQFRREQFVTEVIDVLDRYDIPSGALDMEITEGLVIQRVDDVIATMNQLSKRGVTFSLDDFGTGYSSISYLKKLPVQTLKVDQSFVRDITEDRSDRVLVETIISMGHLLGLVVVAEGVETEEQLKLLKELGCHHYQGYWFSRPLPSADFEQLLPHKLSESTSEALAELHMGWGI